ncbi:ParB/RepB/Spo0J family partition protein [Acinetobacter baumannii]|uniref:ParB/RepB/Spo0J family partition protein n=1 Tax=Acinetobacter baumannii TaxID=470 RepID=UPI00387DC5BC
MGGLDSLDVIGLVAGQSATTKDSLVLPLDKINEDELNVRTIFNELEIKELADSIAANGLKTPISVRRDLERPGFFIVNNGARRRRAFLLLGREEIPAFVDENHDEVDQIIDNLHRVDLTPLEIANKLDVILKAENAPKKEELAQRLAKSKTWLSKHLALLKMPESVKFLYDLGRVTSLDALYLLTSKWSKHGVELAKWLEQYKTKDEIISQTTVQNFIHTLENKNKEKDKPKPSTNGSSAVSDPIDSYSNDDDSNDHESEQTNQTQIDANTVAPAGVQETSSDEFTLAPTEQEAADGLLFVNLSVVADEETKKLFERDLSEWISKMESQYELKVDRI